ncbi:hypothetical protein N5079_25035 [Planotetraspora sp. A-T 1434]|uniref:hypothetical protein n=1 Tax=unclassified Planotetraspora TaxID=2620298 RepID=UPI0021C2315B|nr:hypothetical protein [Planotetraspora sp. A-T 1434]MCT9933483.1 hypothetical protein [Planotetraspora sp. A-T 1434]
MGANERILLFIAIAFALFAAGRQWQRMADLWKGWRESVAAVPVRRKAAWGGVKTMIRVGLVAALVFWLVTNINYFM